MSNDTYYLLRYCTDLQVSFKAIVRSQCLIVGVDGVVQRWQCVVCDIVCIYVID